MVRPLRVFAEPDAKLAAYVRAGGAVSFSGLLLGRLPSATALKVDGDVHACASEVGWVSLEGASVMAATGQGRFTITRVDARSLTARMVFNQLPGRANA